MLMDKHGSLKKTYYKSFFGLIVVPIILIFFGSLSIISVIVRDSAVDSLRSSQGQIVYNLTTSIKDASLQLSHFAYVNDGEFMALAAASDTNDVRARYTAESNLSRAFQIAMLPKQGILSSMVYMKDGGSIYLKDQVKMPSAEIRKSSWYQQALSHPNSVMVGGYDTTRAQITYSSRKRGEFVIVAALAPNISVDRSGKIDVVSIFSTTQVGKLIHEFDNRDPGGVTAILDQEGNFLFGDMELPENALVISKVKDEGEGVYRKMVDFPGKSHVPYTYVVSQEPETGWRVVTGVRTDDLTRGFRTVTIVVMLVITLVMGLFYLFSSYFLTNIIDPVHRIVGGLQQLEGGDLDARLEPAGQREIRDIFHSFNRMVSRLRDSIKEGEEERQKKHEAEMRALQSQINPHFLVNSLNSIRFMAQVSKYEGIRKMAEAMIRILTCSFRSNSSFYTVREELDVLDSFIYLMKIRYSNGFDVAYQVDKDCEDCQIPRLILQPIVENSIVHGFRNTGDDIGHLEISVGRSGDSLVFTVRDDGSGMTEEELRRIENPEPREKDDNYSIGIENVYTRLKLNFGDEFTMKVESEKGSYTQTSLWLPARKDGDKDE